MFLFLKKFEFFLLALLFVAVFALLTAFLRFLFVLQKELFSVSKRHNGSGLVRFAWHPDGTCLATAGVQNAVNIWDRSGKSVATVSLKRLACFSCFFALFISPCNGLDWDRDGEMLAIICEGSGNVMFYDAHSRKTTSMDSGLKENLCFLKWALDAKQVLMPF